MELLPHLTYDASVLSITPAQWRAHQDSSFPARCSHTITKLRDSLFLIGGGACDVTRTWTHYGDVMVNRSTLTEDGSAWAVLATSDGSSLPARRGHSAVVRAGSILVFGGTMGGPAMEGGNRNDVWEFNTEDRTWREVVTRGEPPPARRGHQAVLVEGEMWVLGGYTDALDENCWALAWSDENSPPTWCPVRCSGEHPRLIALFSAELLGNVVFVFGGHAVQQGQAFSELNPDPNSALALTLI